jgi:hypothetical protein
MTSKPKYDIALRPDVDGEDPFDPATLMDDIVVNGVEMFRAEQMDTNVWWVCCYLRNGERIVWDVRAKGRPNRIEWTTTELPDGDFIYEGQEPPVIEKSEPLSDEEWRAYAEGAGFDPGLARGDRAE